MKYILVNGEFLSESRPVLLASNRGYRYGDGIFETMRVESGKVVHYDLHIDRLSRGLNLLGIDIIPGFFQNLPAQIEDIARRNNCFHLGRARLSVYRGNGDLVSNDNRMEYILECRLLAEDSNTWNPNGIVLGLFVEGRKSTDAYSNLKSSSALIYSEAARFAASTDFDDALVINCNGNIADSTIANIFIIRDNEIFTPALPEGCVDGVMRRFLIGKIKEWGMQITETTITPNDIPRADECFLTNAVRGVQWVNSFYEKEFSNSICKKIYELLKGEGLGSAI